MSIITFLKQDFTPPGLYGFKKGKRFSYTMLKPGMQWRLSRANEAYVDIYDDEKDKKKFNDQKYRIEDSQILKVRDRIARL